MKQIQCEKENKATTALIVALTNLNIHYNKQWRPTNKKPDKQYFLQADQSLT